MGKGNKILSGKNIKLHIQQIWKWKNKTLFKDNMKKTVWKQDICKGLLSMVRYRTLGGANLVNIQSIWNDSISLSNQNTY